MTRKEAINVITNADLSKVEDRVIKAIFYLCTNKALKQEPKINPEGNVVYGRDGNLYELTLSNGKEYEQEPMRDATPEELKSVNDYIKSISKPTGVKFDFDEEQEQIDFVQPHKTVGKLISVDVLDNIRAEINGMYRVILKGTSEDDWAVKWNNCLDEVLQIIDKYKTESEE